MKLSEEEVIAHLSRNAENIFNQDCPEDIKIVAEDRTSRVMRRYIGGSEDSPSGPLTATFFATIIVCFDSTLYKAEMKYEKNAETGEKICFCVINESYDWKGWIPVKHRAFFVEDAFQECEFGENKIQSIQIKGE